MEKLLLFLAQSLVDEPDSITITTTESEESTTLILSVAEKDMGKVIGKQGRIAKAIRTIIKAASMKTDKRVFVEIE